MSVTYIRLPQAVTGLPPPHWHQQLDNTAVPSVITHRLIPHAQFRVMILLRGGKDDPYPKTE
jgi:hypothetical protein